MKIAFIGQKGIPARFGGVEAHVEALATRLAARGHEVEVYVRSWYTSRELEQYEGVGLRHLPTLRTKHFDAAVHSFLATLNGLSSRHDILHFHAIGPGSFALLPHACGRRSVLTVHSLDWQRTKWRRPARALMRLGEAVAVRSASRIIAISAELRDYVRERYRRSAVLIPNGVEQPPPVPAGSSDILEGYGLKPDGYLLYLGRFVPEKRLELLIDAFRELTLAGFPGQLVLAGGADLADAYARSLQERAGGLRCIFPGFVAGANKAALLRGARVAVLPSDLEGLPIFLLEAMACGVPCVASDLPPHRQLLGEDRGFLFAAGDREEVARSLHHALALDDAERLGLGERASLYVKAHHNWERIAEATEEVYLDLMERPRRVA